MWVLIGHDFGHLLRFGGLRRGAKPVQIQHVSGGLWDVSRDIFQGHAKC
jgi:hypothetical protein